MQRDPARLQRHAVLVAADLVHTLGGEWSCEVSDAYVLRVTGQRWEGVVEVDEDVYEDEDEPGGPAVDLDLDLDACEAVADQVVELLGNAKIAGPPCLAHGVQLEILDGVWACGEGHLVAPVGELAAR